MKNTINHILEWPRALMLTGLILFSMANVYGQFQKTIGATFPIVDKGSGVITPSGDFLLCGYKFDVLNLNGTARLDWLDNAGNFINPSNALDVSVSNTESGVWIEKNVFCGSGNEYVLIGDDDQGEMLVSRVTTTGTPVWTRAIGSPGSIENGVWGEMDPNGLILALGNSYDLNNFISSVALAQLDCNGNTNWRNTFSISGYSLTATFGTSFPTTPGGVGVCYITGRATSLLTGVDQLFLMQINTSGGVPSFFKLYDIVPNADDAGTCIQGSAQFGPQGGELWISGYSIDNNAQKTAVLMKTDLNGTPLWAKDYDVTGGDEFFNHFNFAANGKLALTGKVLETTVFQGTKGGDCMLMRLDATSGNVVDWVHGYTQNDFTAQGNRVEVTANDEYFISGQSTEVLTPSISAGNILTILTDAQGHTNNTCYYDTIVHISPRIPMVSSFGLPSFSLGFLSNNLARTVTSINFQDQQKSCAPPMPCDCDFTWNLGNCSNVTFNANCQNPMAGNYTYSWDIFCDNNPELTVVVGAPNNAFSYGFDCGAGTYTVCLKVTDPAGNICTTTHTVVVPNTCCGSASGSMICHPTDPYKYNFTINVTPDISVSNCNYVLTSAYPLSNLVYLGNTITGCIAVTDPVPTALNFTLQSNCICNVTGLPTTCTQTVWVPTVCCKKICVDDQDVCNGLDEYHVPFYACEWPPVNNVYQVSWYVIPKPATGCPGTYWGGQPYQSTAVTNNNLEPLHIFPSILPADLCVYAVIDLNDGPCTQIFSNIATISLCNPNSCTLNSQQHCYMGTCISPQPLLITSTANAPVCFGTVEWFDPQGNSVQIGGSSYQPPCLSMANNQNCYEDFIYSVVITDDCGPHTCTANIRLYSDDASLGTVTLVPPDQSPLCFSEDATLKFTPNCAQNPPGWVWYERDCQNGALTLHPEAGLSNTCFNVNELRNGTWFGIGSVNGVCPIKGEEILVDVTAPAVIFDFTAVADPCAEVQVVLSASVVPGADCTGAIRPCTYTYEWYKDGFLIFTTVGGSASETYTYFNPLPLPSTVAGVYYVIIREDCCPRNLISSWPLYIEPSCEQCIMGPCFICDNQPETFSIMMVLPPSDPCPDACTFTWYQGVLDGSGNCVPGPVLGNLSSVTLTNHGQYFVESDCNGCKKLTKFDVLGCASQLSFGQQQCGVISVEELMSKDESPLHIFPNPTTGEITIEWSGNAPKTRGYIFLMPWDNA
jgi:hypothetical protein